MRRLILMTVTFVGLFSLAPFLLPLEGLVSGFAIFVCFVVWRTWLRKP
jgi:hypothetical protein